MKIAIPSNDPGGLDATISDHFGHCDVFTLVDVEEGKVTDIQLIPNAGHVQGGCMGPVMLLKNAGADIMAAGGMGMRPLAGFQQVGITVYFTENATTVKEIVDLIIAGKARPFGPAQVCGGGDCGSKED